MSALASARCSCSLQCSLSVDRGLAGRRVLPVLEVNRMNWRTDGLTFVGIHLGFPD